MPGGISLWHADVSDERTPAENARAFGDVDLALRIGVRLDDHYKGHHFRVAVDSGQGIATVTLPSLLPVTMKYNILLRELFSDPGMKCVMRAGGELLERFQERRGWKNPERWYETVAKHRHVRHAQAGYLNRIDMSTGKVTREVPDALAR